MPITRIYSFLTLPNKNKPDDPLSPGAEIPVNDGRLCKMLGNIFDNAAEDCPTSIIFTPEEGKQENEVRSALLALAKKPSLALARPLASRLQAATSGSSGKGLLFVCVGKDDKTTRIVISRFPADEGVVANTNAKAKTLSIEFVEQVFMKSAYSYKAATYLYAGKADDLWTGHAVDKQTSYGPKAMANYWIVDFLKSDFATTPAAGTKRLAQALKKATAESSDPAVKADITAAVRLAANMPGNAMSIDGFCQIFQLSKEAREVIASKVSPARLLGEQFQFDKHVFAATIRYAQVELSNGAVLTAPAESFDECFTVTIKDEEATYSTTGTVVDHRLKTSK